MPPEPIITALRRRPFTPVRLHLADDSSYEVRHPEMLIMSAGYLALGVPGSAPPPVAEHIVTFSLGHIVRMEPIESVPASGNGH